MPPEARRACVRSASVPAVTAADATNGPPGSSVRSANSSSATMPSTISVPCRNRPGPSTETAVDAVTDPRLVRTVNLMASR